MRSLFVCVFLALACAHAPAKPVAIAREAPAADARHGDEGEPARPEPDYFHHAVLRTEKAALPARYTAPIPGDVRAAFKWRNAPPLERIAPAVCSGDEAVRNELAAAVDAAAAKGASTVDLRAAYSKVVLHCSEVGFCAWAGELTTSAESPAAREFWWHALERCHDEATRTRFASPDAPLVAFVAWYLRQEPQPSKLDPRYPAAVRTLTLASIGSAAAKDLRNAVYELATFDDPRAIETVIALYRRKGIAEPLQSSIVQGLQSNTAKKARRFAAKHCKKHGARVCALAGRLTRPRAVDPFADLDATVVGITDVGELARQHPQRRDDIVHALVRCLSNYRTPLPIERCLERLALIDRPRAVALAPSLRAPDERVAALQAILLAYPEASDLDAKLDAVGLVANPHTKPKPADGIEIADVLEARGRSLTFDVETTTFPNRHDTLMQELAQLIAPDLDGVVFEQITPTELEGHPPYVLVAYMDGQRHEVYAQDLGDRFDVAATIGMLNALARHRDKPGRFVLVSGDGQEATVLGADAAAIESAMDDGVIEIAPVSAEPVEHAVPPAM